VKGRARSLVLTPQALTIVLAVALIHSVWRGSGARIAIVAEVALVVVLLVDLAWSAWVASHVDVVVVANPHDATVGDPVTSEVMVRGPGLPVEVRMLSATRPAWYRIDPPDRGSLIALAPSRGIATAAVFEARCTAPLGLLGMTTKSVVALPHPMVVGPRPEPIPGARLPQRGAIPTDQEVVRGTRPWVPGDPMRSVHWPSVARTGELLVKELEPPPSPQVVIAVELGLGGSEGEHAASRGAWLAEEALRRGCAVTLATIEGEQVIAARVRSPLEVARRLAAATIGQRFTTAPDPRSIIWVRSEGDTFP
jgi:uncharacterized protein (DUF58 family)